LSASEQGHVEIVKVLIAAGGKDIVNEKDNVSERYCNRLDQIIQ
jgi:predicted ABC-type ATPase